jgi:hypothetical protein
MKNLNFIVAFALIVLMAGPSCQKFNLNTDDLDLKINLDVIKTSVTVQFRDANTDELIGMNAEEQVALSIFGPDSQWVVNTSGERKAYYFSAGGFAKVGLDPYNAKPTHSDPVKFTIVAELGGFLSTSLPVTLFTEGIHDFVIKMVRIVSPPEGVDISVRDNAGSMTDGKLDGDLALSSDNSDLKISLPGGTVMRDSDGKILQGKLDVVMAYFNPTKEEAISAFPGGLDVDVTNEGGSRTSGNFVSAGFVAVEIKDETGKKASNFSNGQLDLSAAVDGKIMNPETGQPVKDGDKVPIWSYNTKSGQWTYEKFSIIKSTPTGLRTETQLTHLSYWNLDWLEASCAFIELFFTSSDATKVGEGGWGYGIYFYATLAGSTQFRTEGYFSGYPEITGTKTENNTEVLQSVPLNRQVTITFYYPDGTTPLWNLPAPITYDLCASSPIEIPLTPNPDATGGGGSQTLTISFDITIECIDNPGVAVTPNDVLLRYRQKGTTTWSFVTASLGKFIVAGLIPNKVYEVQALYNNEWTPAPPFEYTVEPSTQTQVSKTITFQVECGG